MKVNLEKECLEELGRKIKEIARSNQDMIDAIISRKKSMLTCGYSFSLKCETKSKPWSIVSTPFKYPVSLRLRNWRYNGDKLEETEDIFNDKIDYTMETWQDVQHLNKDLHKVGCKYCDRLADRIENRRDMCKFLNNMAKLEMQSKMLPNGQKICPTHQQITKRRSLTRWKKS